MAFQSLFQKICHCKGYHSAGIFGLVMYLAGVISIFLYKYILPVETMTEAKTEVVKENAD